MSKIMILLAVMVYAGIAGAHIYLLLVQAWKHTKLEKPEVYILCGALWPIMAAPAFGYILAGWYINREEDKAYGEEKQGKDLHG